MKWRRIGSIWASMVRTNQLIYGPPKTKHSGTNVTIIIRSTDRDSHGRSRLLRHLIRPCSARSPNKPHGTIRGRQRQNPSAALSPLRQPSSTRPLVQQRLLPRATTSLMERGAGCALRRVHAVGNSHGALHRSAATADYVRSGYECRALSRRQRGYVVLGL